MVLFNKYLNKVYLNISYKIKVLFTSIVDLLL